MLLDELVISSTIPIGEEGPHIDALQMEMGAGIVTGVWSEEDEHCYRCSQLEFLGEVRMMLIQQDMPRNWKIFDVKALPTV